MAENKNDALGFAIRQFGALAGAVGLINLVKDSLEWQHNIGVWLDAFRSFTRPVASFLFGWIPALFHWPFPGWTKDYLTVGIVTLLAVLRADLSGVGRRQTILNNLKNLRAVAAEACWGIFFVTVWPLLVLFVWRLYFDKRADSDDKSSARVFAAAYVYAALLIVINYVFIAAGSRTGE